MNLECVEIGDGGHPLLAFVEKTYVSSFPRVERRDFPLVVELFKAEPRFRMYAFKADGAYIGFISCWKFEGFVYVEHFAIDEAARNGGFGGTAMKLFVEMAQAPVVLEVEPPEDEMSIRRIGFYERLGFVLNSNLYAHPPYREGDKWLPMRLMSHGKIDLDTMFEEVKRTLHKYVYNLPE